MKRYPVLIGIAVLALLVAISAGAFLYLRPAGFGKPKLPQAPYGGVTRSYDARAAVIDNIKLESLPGREEFLKAFAKFLTVRTLEFSGTLAPPGMQPLPFRARIAHDATPGLRSVEFRARGNGRELELDGSYNLADRNFSADLRGELGSQEFRALGIPFDRLHGSVAFGGRIELQGFTSDAPVQLELSGSFARNSWLELGMFRLSEPGSFRCRAERDGSWRLQLPDAKFAFSTLLLSGLEFQSAGKESMKFTSQLNLTLPYQLSSPLPLTGTLNHATGAWNFDATGGDMLFLSTSQSLTRLNRLHLEGSGNGKGGKFTFDAAGESFSLRPDRNAAVLWNGIDVQFSGWRELQFLTPGKVNTGKDELKLKFRSFELTGSGRRMHIAAPELTITGSGREDTLRRVFMRAGRITARHAEESLELEQPEGSASVLVNDGEIIILEHLAAKAKSLLFVHGPIRGTAQNPELSGNFDRLNKRSGDQLRFMVQGGEVDFNSPEITCKAERAEWQLSAEFPRGLRRPPSWKHRFAARNGEVRRGPVNGRFSEAALALELADSDLSPRNAALDFKTFSGIYSPLRDPEPWRFDFSACSGKAERQLDGWIGKITANGELESKDKSLRFAGIALDLPFVPAAASAPATGSLTVASVSSPDKLVDSLKAELTTQGTDLRWRGTTSSALLSGGGFFFTGTLGQRDGAYDLFSEYRLPLTRLNAPIQPGRLLPFSPKWRFQGRLGATGELTIGENRLRRTVAYELDGEATLAPWTISGLTGTLAIGKPSELSFRKITPGAGDISDGKLQFMLAPDGETLQKAEFIFAGGMAKLAQETAFSAGKSAELELEVNGIQPVLLLNLPPGCELGGNYSGTVRGVWSAKGFELRSAQLRSGAGNLALAPLEPFRYIPATGTNPELFEFAAAALKHFKAQKIELRMRRGAHGLDLRVKAEGAPGSALPFVYENGSFRRQRETEYGFSGDVTISSDYRISEAQP